jgi:hypothetical protein
VAFCHKTGLNYVSCSPFRVPIARLAAAQGPRPGRGDRSGQGSTTGVGMWLVAGVGDEVGAADRLLKDLRYPDIAYAGDEVQVELSVTHRFLEGAEPGPVTITLAEDGQVLRQESHELVQETTNLSLTFTAPEEGLRVLELSVSPLDNERFLANNTVSLAVNVRPDRSRLLLLASQPGWDTRFLAQAANAEQRLVLDAVYPGPAGLIHADSTTAWRTPTTVEGWRRWNGVILQGWREVATQVDWPSLQEAVDQGLGLLVIPGAGHPDRRTLDVPVAGLLEMLPVEALRWQWLRGSFALDLPASASGHPVLNLGQSGYFNSAEPLSGIPPLRALIPVRPREEALVLLQTRVAASGEDGQPVSPGMPALVAGGSREGRVAFFGGRRLWELAFWDSGRSWAGAPDDHPQPVRAILRNLLVWLASTKEDGGLVFSGSRTFFQEGEKISLGAVWRDMRGLPVTDRGVSLQLAELVEGQPPGQPRTFTMEPDAGSPGESSLELPPLPPGRYGISLVGQGDPPQMGASSVLVVTTHSMENTQVRQDRRRLVQLAARGGGPLVSATAEGALERIASAVEGLDWSGREIRQRRRLDFYSGWPFLVAVVTLLGVEWFLRRRNGML